MLIKSEKFVIDSLEASEKLEKRIARWRQNPSLGKFWPTKNLEVDADGKVQLTEKGRSIRTARFVGKHRNPEEDTLGEREEGPAREATGVVETPARREEDVLEGAPRCRTPACPGTICGECDYARSFWQRKAAS